MQSQFMSLKQKTLMVQWSLSQNTSTHAYIKDIPNSVCLLHKLNIVFVEDL